MTPDELLDGFALWEEHKPQSGEDWIAVAKRCVADETFDVAKSSALFAGLFLLARDHAALVAERDALARDHAALLDWAARAAEQLGNDICRYQGGPVQRRTEPCMDRCECVPRFALLAEWAEMQERPS